jgi:hypothetical protein
MIDYFALALGHGLLAFALVHLFFRAEVDHDPLINSIKEKVRAHRMTASTAGRNAQRRAKVAEDGDPADEDHG